MPEYVIKLDEHGRLYINKGAGLKRQDCPYTLFDAACGDRCPLFSMYDDKERHRRRRCRSILMPRSMDCGQRRAT